MSRFGHLAVRVVAATSIALFVLVIVVDTLNGWPLGPWQALVVTVNTAVGLVYVGVGWLLAERRPRNPIGVLILLVGVIYALFGPVDLYLTLGSEGAYARLAALAVTSVGYVGGLCLAIALILFPDGAPPSPRWRWIIVIAVAGAVIGVVAVTFGSTTFGPIYPSIENPFAITGFPKSSLLSIADTVSTMASLAGVAAVLLRWWRGTPLVRAQTTWVLAAVVVMFLASRLAEQADDIYDDVAAWLGLLQNASAALIPLAMAVAILRYRLYEIDRVVSRTIGWAVITAVGLGALAITILVVSGLLGRVATSGLFGFETGAAGTTGTAEETVAVALSTLIVAAGIQPLRRRVQSRVDRWFHRAHYDAERTASAFADRVRTGVEMATLVADLRQTVTQAVEPRSTAVWMRTTAR